MSKPVRIVLIVLAEVAVCAIIGPVLGWQAAFGGVCAAIGVLALYYFTDQPEHEDETDGDH
ncbi:MULTISPECIES: hypothetical protein [unclassified Streptomyces]|uniref:hypothetical protein n=1 Tax=unclassified Streptomyces TaxID=2593676 RepID=UPI002E188A5A|nr:MULTISPECIES: hypothetical protein [unclassified Streptomyces]